MVIMSRGCRLECNVSFQIRVFTKQEVRQVIMVEKVSPIELISQLEVVQH